MTKSDLALQVIVSLWEQRIDRGRRSLGSVWREQASLRAGHCEWRILLAPCDSLGKSLPFWASAFTPVKRTGWADGSLRLRILSSLEASCAPPFQHIKSGPQVFLISVALRTTKPHTFLKHPAVLRGIAFSCKRRRRRWILLGIASHFNHTPPSLLSLDLSLPVVSSSPDLNFTACGASFTTTAIFHLWLSGEFISFHCSVSIAQIYIQGWHIFIMEKPGSQTDAAHRD